MPASVAEAGAAAGPLSTGPEMPKAAPPGLPGGAAVRSSGLAENPVEVGSADRADGLRHPGALVVHANLTLSLALLLALDAVELAAPGLRHDGLLASCLIGRRDGVFLG